MCLIKLVIDKQQACLNIKVNDFALFVIHDIVPMFNE